MEGKKEESGTGTPSAKGKAILRAGGETVEVEAKKGRISRVLKLDQGNWGKSRDETVRRAGAKKKTRNRRMDLTKCDIHFSPSITRFAHGDLRKNNKDRVILSTSIMSSKILLISSCGWKGSNGKLKKKKKKKNKLVISLLTYLLRWRTIGFFNG